MTNAVFGLLTKHQKLDAALRTEQSRKMPDTIRIQRLKKLKLGIKDQLHRLSLGRRFATA